MRARSDADALVRAARAITLGARRAQVLKRVALLGAALAAIIWLGAPWYAGDPATTQALAMPSAAPEILAQEDAVPATLAGPSLSLKMADELQRLPADR